MSDPIASIAPTDNNRHIKAYTTHPVGEYQEAKLWHYNPDEATKDQIEEALKKVKERKGTMLYQPKRTLKALYDSLSNMGKKNSRW